jgi:glycosyltransferase involved in cell wall biosynthesis
LSKIKIYHFHNGSGGGVLSVIKNLLKFSSNESIENHIIHAVNKKLYPQYKIEPIEGAVSQQLYFYSPNNNFYFTCKQLAKLLPNNKAIIVAHDWVELGMASNLGLQNPVVQILHGDFDYYYDLSKKNEKIIDAFICISPKIYKSLHEKLPFRSNDIFNLKFPVPRVNKKNCVNDVLQLIYFVRDLKEPRKRFDIVIEIARKLSIRNQNYFFTIAGGGISEKEFFEIWPTDMKDFVKYYSTLSNNQIIEMLPKHDIFLLPSESEGFPVSLVEAMKAGIVPLITNWDGAVDELISSAETGFYFDIGDANDYVDCIIISNNASLKANTLFDPAKNVLSFENIYINISNQKKGIKSPLKVYGSRLDELYIPNVITKMFRLFNKGA